MTTVGLDTRRKLLAEQDGKCHYCDQPMLMEQGLNNSITVDHVVPRSVGGTRHHANIVGACWQCNNLRGDLPYFIFISLREDLIERRGLPTQQRSINRYRYRMRAWHAEGQVEVLRTRNVTLTRPSSEPGAPSEVRPIAGASLGSIWPQGEPVAGQSDQA